MALPKSRGDREYQKFVESSTVANLPSVAVVNPDGTDIGGSSSAQYVKILSQTGTALDEVYSTIEGLKVHIVGSHPFLIEGQGTAGTGTAGVLTIQGDPSGTAIPITGTVTATAVQSGTWDIGTLTTITNDVSIDDGGNVITVDGTVTATPPKAASANTSGKVSVGSSSTSVVASNASRKLLILVNDSDEDMYINFSATAVMNEGIRLNKKGGHLVDDGYTGAVTGICSSGSKNITVTEL